MMRRRYLKQRCNHQNNMKNLALSINELSQARSLEKQPQLCCTDESNQSTYPPNSNSIPINIINEMLPSSDEDSIGNSVCETFSGDDIYDDSDDHDERETYTFEDFKHVLATAFLNANLSHSQGDQILAALRTHPSLSLLPKVTKTLLHTPRQALKPIPMGSVYRMITLELLACT
ncbi:hypothetical protein PV325_011350 [Microctonus aethiopoides]|nr:hypothetical protein PV325_011350 [Microctonus aethiopoides]